MASLSKARDGSLQYWPRKRVRKVLPRVNWEALQKKEEDKILGFLCYKVGMKSALVKDNTPESLTKGKNIILPITILEVPPMKIFSIRFYKNKKIIKEILNENLDKELKRKVKIPKEKKKIDLNKEFEEIKKEIDDIRIIVYSNVKKTGIKKTPDILEIGLNGSLEEKINFIKEYLNKDICIGDFLKINQTVDVRGITKAYGTAGPVKRFGISLRQHKSEKGVRRPGSLGPWKPSHVTFRTPMAGQLGYFHRSVYNLKVLDIGKIEQKDINPKGGFEHFGKIRTNYVIIKGSVPGNEKACLILTLPLRENKKSRKENYQLIKII
ncbi:MAG: 50S ribosomal protein L3 [Candidatus Pacearchaeota archaeon]